MIRYLLRRLLLLVPTVWLILSVVFLFSRLLPGTFQDRMSEISQSAMGAGSTRKPDRQQYLAGLQATGHDRPLFYFSLHPLSQPDTLWQVFPPAHQPFLQELAAAYGNWPAVSRYYHRLLTLQQTVEGLPAQQAESLAGPLAALFRCTAADQIQGAFAQVRAALHTPGQGQVARQVLAAEASFRQLQSRARPWQAFIPVLSWHGSQNQYHTWLLQLLQGDLGNSYRDQQPVAGILSEAISNSLLLLAAALLLTFLISIELSLALMAGSGRRWQRLVLSLLFILDSIPLFIVALLLLVFLSGTGYLSLFPLFGLGYADAAAPFWEVWGNRLYHLVLPGICLVISGIPYVTTQLYRVMQGVADAVFIMTARSKGLSAQVVLRRHVLRNALLPLITLFTGFLPSLISGALVVEVIFAIPGTGRLLADSVLARDYPVVLGLVFFLAVLKAGSHLLADFLYFTADPRTRIKVL
jgi:peptide/nickel transport system permease protein